MRAKPLSRYRGERREDRSRCVMEDAIRQYISWGVVQYGGQWGSVGWEVCLLMWCVRRFQGPSDGAVDGATDKRVPLSQV